MENGKVRTFSTMTRCNGNHWSLYTSLEREGPTDMKSTDLRRSALLSICTQSRLLEEFL
jgi:hypothetical protein